MGKLFQHLDVRLTLLLIAVGCFGLGIIFTVNAGLFSQQLVFFLLGIVLLIIASCLDSMVLYAFSPLFYMIGTVFLSFSYMGPTIRGARRWILVFGSQLQPSELVKPFLLLGFSYFIAKYPPRTLKNICIQTGLFFIPFFLIFRQPDLGSSIVYFFMWIAMLVAGGLPLGIFFGGVISFVVSVPLLWHVLADYQKNRILTFLSPNNDPSGTGYNALQSMIAVGSGQIFGKGLGLGTQSHLRFLPEYHTDFIFGTLVEELGFVGGAFLLFLYVLILLSICMPFLKQRIQSPFIFIFTSGLLYMMLSQITINTGMNMGIVPITGITLPLVSYGGSSLLSVLTSFGLFMALKAQSQPDRTGE